MALTVLSVAYPFAPVGPDAVGGAEQVLSMLDRALVEHGHRSIVIACEGSKTAGELVAIRTARGTIDEGVRRSLWAAFRATIADVLRQKPVDLVHLHGIDFAEYIPEDAPTLATLHLPLAWYPALIFRPRANLSLHCVSEAQHASRPAGAHLLPPIPNGVSPAFFETACAKQGHAIVLSRICEEKGIHIALEASHLAGAPLLIGGQVFPYEAHQRYFAERVAPLLDAERRFLGPVGFDRKRELLASARCALVPSLCAETSSLTAIEALASGTPVIAFPNGALPQVVEHGRTGFIVSDAREMADAIAAAGNLDPADCRRAAAERFPLNRMVTSYLDTYYRLAKAAETEARLSG